MKLYIGVNKNGTAIVSKKPLFRVTFAPYWTTAAEEGDYMELNKEVVKVLFKLDLTWENEAMTYEIIEKEEEK